MHVFLVEGTNAADKYLKDASVRDEMPKGESLPLLVGGSWNATWTDWAGLSAQEKQCPNNYHQLFALRWPGRPNMHHRLIVRMNNNMFVP